MKDRTSTRASFFLSGEYEIGSDNNRSNRERSRPTELCRYSRPNLDQKETRDGVNKGDPIEKKQSNSEEPVAQRSVTTGAKS
jgi:hypothetical protein